MVAAVVLRLLQSFERYTGGLRLGRTEGCVGGLHVLRLLQSFEHYTGEGVGWGGEVGARMRMRGGGLGLGWVGAAPEA